MIGWAVASFVLAAIPAVMTWGNLRLFCRQGPQGTPITNAEVSVLIPARNEAIAIADCVRSVLASTDVTVEVIVLDDHSDDETAEIVKDMGIGDARVKCEMSVELPSDWNGKQFACYQLSRWARFDTLVFLDADVTLQPEALRRCVNYCQQHAVDLLSAFPRQVTGTWLEKWLIPMMYYLLLGYLPFARMRASRSTAYSAGCGQLFLTTRSAYEQAGTHAAIKNSRHDGIQLPYAFRKAGLITDVIDGTEFASCRMYTTATAVVQGLLKNANEGIARMPQLVLFSVLLLGGSVLPVGCLLSSFVSGHWAGVIIAGMAMLLGHWPRFVTVTRFKQSLQGALFHAPAVCVFLAIQWLAFILHLTGQRVRWRGR